MSRLPRRKLASACALAVASLLSNSPVPANTTGFIGLLRARDLTPFGFLRLDMRPPHAVASSPGAWGVETELAYQNTWALSENAEKYLSGLPGRRELGPAEYQALRDLPGENYLVDLELAQLDLTLHYKLSTHLGTYITFSGVSYSGGFLDSAIEKFHDTFGFSSFGRTAAGRNDVNILFDLKSAQEALFTAPTNGGLLDPTIGLRYSGVAMPDRWNFVIETAAKVPLEGRRRFLSTGRTDFGVQAALQRFWSRHAVYLAASAVYYDGSMDTPATQSQVIPTVILGVEARLTGATHVVLQGYLSQSVYSRHETDLAELLKNKYQLSLGIYHLFGRGLLSFGLTENLQNLNNTPDIGMQIGWTFSPAFLPQSH